MKLIHLALPVFVLLQISRSTQLSASNSTGISNTITATSSLRPIVARVFSRKKRFLLVPKGTALKVTLALSKHLISMFPRGFNFVLEAAMYYPGPSSRLDLIPKRLRPPTTTTPKPSGPTEPSYVYIPGSLVRYKAKPATKPSKVQRIGAGAVKWIDSQQYQKYTNPQKWLPWAKYGSPGYEQKYAWTPAQHQQHQWQAPTHAKWTKWTTPMPKTQQWPQWRPTKRAHNKWRRRQRATEYEFAEEVAPDAHEYVPMDLPELEPFERWTHYHSYRDRRHLYHQFEGLSQIMGIDMKSCLLRAICDSKRFLQPKGYSLIQDIVRVIFSFPTISGLTDDYSRAVQEDADTCHQQVGAQCPFSLLDWLMSRRKGFPS